MKEKIKIHDGIVGTVIVLSLALAYAVDPRWMIVPAVIGLLMIQSAFTGFCPVYFIINKLKPAQESS